MNQVLLALVSAVVVYPTARFALAGIGRGRFALASRFDVLPRVADSVLALTVAQVFVPWTMISPAMWLVPVCFVALGASATVARWTSLPVLQPSKQARGRVILPTIHAGLSLAATAILVVFA